jgi:hypothetical protein
VTEDRDLSTLVVPRAEAVGAGGDLCEPIQMVDAGGDPVTAVAAFLKDLQASGRLVPTQRSYSMDLLRWSRLIWAIEVPWDEATVRGTRLLSMARMCRQDKTSSFCWPIGEQRAEPSDRQAWTWANVLGHDACALGDRAASLLRLPPRCRDRSDGNPFPLSRSPRWPKQRPSQPDGALAQ